MNRELRAAILRQRKQARSQAEERRAFEEGQLAFARGVAVDRNPKRAQPLRAAWARGWHHAERAEADYQIARHPPELRGDPTVAARELAEMKRILEQR